MSEARSLELWMEHTRGQAQFAYFQLGLAVSAIAFATQQTRDEALATRHWVIGLAVALWAGSFLAGSAGLRRRLRGLSGNSAYLSGLIWLARAGYAEAAEEVTAEAKADIQGDFKTAAARFVLQGRLLVFGVIAYVVGHVWRMASI